MVFPFPFYFVCDYFQFIVFFCQKKNLPEKYWRTRKLCQDFSNRSFKFQAQVGSIYIPPVPAENLAYKPTPAPTYIQPTQSEENNRPRQTTPLRWMASRPTTKETPEWAKEDNVIPSSINRPQSMYKPQTNTSNQPQTNNNAMFSTTNTYQPTPSLAANTGLKLQIQSVGSQPKVN